VAKLSTCYFFTVEFGLCKEEYGLRVYGAGLLSSIGELKHALSGKAVIKEFDPEVTSKEECMITCFQKNYFYTNSFEEASQKLRDYAKSIARPFQVKYDDETESIKIISESRKWRKGERE